MDYRLEDLIDIPLFQILQDKLNEIYSFPSAIIDNEGKILTATAWQDICTKFHRVNPLSEEECKLSDQYILSHLHEANPAVSYRCPHGMVDNATPIIIDGRHLGNFFTGQLFLDKPDMEFFKKQAVKYGFDEKPYLEAVSRVPVWTREKLDRYLDFIKTFTEILAGIGLKNLKEIEARQIIAEKEKALMESEARFRAVFENSRDAVGVSKSGTTLFLNRAYVEMFGYNRIEEMTGKSILDHIAPSERPRIIENIRMRNSGGNAPERYETRGLRKNGEEFPFEINVGTYRSDNEQYTIATIRDITERKKTEETIAWSLREKETLLKEIHHRVKNNMQIISSLLNLQAMTLKDENAREPFRVSQSRIQSMALIHEKLYKSKNMSSINFGEYLNELVDEINEFNSNTAGNVSYSLNVKEIFVDLDKAIPCGLIVTELVTNAIKHAFPKNAKGEIIINFDKTDGNYLLTIRDNGKGMKGTQERSTDGTLGLELVEILNKQLKGEMSIASENGTAITIKFPV